MVIFLMNLVNNAEGSFYVLDHAPWDGLTLADFVMPFFLFMVGASIALAYTRQLERGASRWDLWKKAAIRTAKLFGLAYFLAIPRWDLQHLRIPGVLQRIAFCYFVVCSVYLWVPVAFKGARGPFRFITQYLWHWLIALGILIIYIGLLFGLQVPGCEQRGLLTPRCNAAGWIDYNVFTLNHMYCCPTCMSSDLPPDQRCQYYDPEGLLTTFVASLSVFVGLYYGIIVVQVKEHKYRLMHWLIPCIGFFPLAFGLHFSGAIPLNKNLYSISYISMMAAAAACVLALNYVVMDWVKFQVVFLPFVWLGMNAIILYVGDGLIGKILGPSSRAMIFWGDPSASFGSWVQATMFDSWMSPKVAAMMWGIGHACIWFPVAFVMYRKQIFIRV